MKYGESYEGEKTEPVSFWRRPIDFIKKYPIFSILVFLASALLIVLIVLAVMKKGELLTFIKDFFGKLKLRPRMTS